MAIEILDSGMAKALFVLGFNTLYTELRGRGVRSVEHVAEGNAIVELEEAIDAYELGAFVFASAFPGGAPQRVAQLDYVDATHLRVRLWTVGAVPALAAGAATVLVLRQPMVLVDRDPPA